MFDLDAAFEEFCSQFENKPHLDRARALWATLVNGDEAAQCHADLMARLTPAARAATPEWALKKIFRAKLPDADAPQVVAPHTSAPTQAPRVPSENLNAFREIWASWPHDVTRRREQEAHAKFEWDRCVADHGVAATRAACLDIARDEARLTHRRNLSTVLAALISGEEDLAVRPPVTADDLTAFDAAHGRYPNPADDQEEAIDLYLAYVPADQRLEFMAAVREYAATTRGKEREYVKDWSTFVSRDWKKRDVSKVIANAAEVALEKTHGKLSYYTLRGKTVTAVVQDAADQHNADVARLREKYDAATPRDEVAGWEYSKWATWPTCPDSAENKSGRRRPIETDRLVREPSHDGDYRIHQECGAVDEGLPCCCGDWIEMPGAPVVVDVEAVRARAYEWLAGKVQAGPAPAIIVDLSIPFGEP